jgi:kynurenine formamidase
MAEANVALIGMDALNVDNIEDLSWPVHHIVLGKDIPLIAHLTNLKPAALPRLPPGRATRPGSTAWAASRSAP